jgi:hypothetical protein
MNEFTPSLNILLFLTWLSLKSHKKRNFFLFNLLLFIICYLEVKQWQIEGLHDLFIALKVKHILKKTLEWLYMVGYSWIHEWIVVGVHSKCCCCCKLLRAEIATPNHYHPPRGKIREQGWHLITSHKELPSLFYFITTTQLGSKRSYQE